LRLAGFCGALRMGRRVSIWLDDEMAALLDDRCPNRQLRGGFLRGAVHLALTSKRPVAGRKYVPGRLPKPAEELLARIEAGEAIDPSAHKKDLALLLKREKVALISGQFYPL
jgi:hypothetical protein